MTDGQIEFKTYTLTGNTGLLNEENHITPEIKRLLERLYPNVRKGKKGMVKRLTALAIKHPKVPTFKNYLTMLHSVHGNKERAYQANRWLMEEHPDYLYAKLNLAAEYLEKKTPEPIPEVLGEMFDLQDLYPERDEFHIEEFLAINAIAAQYYLMIGETGEAERRLELMKDADPDHPKTHQIEEHLMFDLFEKVAERHAEEEAFRKSVDVDDRRSAAQTDVPPNFNFPMQMQWLYEGGFDIDFLKIRSILDLPRAPLVQDLCAILKDSIVRFDFYESGWEYGDRPLNFSIHAMVLLGELKAADALESILETLRQDEDYVDFWFGDILPEVAVPALVNCGGEQLEKLLAFMKEPNRYTFSKCLVSEAVIKMARVDSSRWDEAVQWSGRLLDFHAENWKDGNRTDSDFIGLFVADLVDAKMQRLLPKIKKLYELQIVGYGMCGDYESVENDIFQGSDYGLEILKQDWQSNYKKWSSYQTEHDQEHNFSDDFGYQDEGLDYFPDNQKPILKPKKVGRNNPCPCGSGKKYKKCCINIL